MTDDNTNQDPIKYAEMYDGDLRIFLHQLAEISAVCGLPYDSAFDLTTGRFEWKQGVVVLHAGPGRRSVLVIDDDQFPQSTLDIFAEFCHRHSIRGVAGVNLSNEEADALEQKWRVIPPDPVGE